MIDLNPRHGFSFTVAIEHDDSARAPWEDCDGHGPVSEWRRQSYNGHYSKSPGELFLCDDDRTGLRGNGRALFYDYQDACRIALRDGWGFLPHALKVTKAWGKHKAQAGPFVTRWHKDINAAIADINAQHRATYPSAKAYAAAAARADFERLRGYCNDHWSYVGVIVTACRNGLELGTSSLWGIESDSTDYLEEVAKELASDALEEGKAALASLCNRKSAAA